LVVYYLIAGFVGMALSYDLAINVFLILSVQYQCFVAESNVSVERLEQYMHIPSEAPEAIETNRPLHNWPSVGEVEIRNLKVDFTISQIHKFTGPDHPIYQITSNR
jgi:hypothetical protein